jgi:hypothetical protein
VLRADPLHPALAVALLLASAGMVVADHLPAGVGGALVVAYLLLAPGYALLPFFGRQHWLLHALLVLSLGVALAVGIATAMSETGWWRVEVGVAATWLLVVVTVLWRGWRNKRAVVRLLVGVR